MSYNMKEFLNKEKKETTPVPDGHYEVNIASVKKVIVGESKSPAINLTYKVRNDVNQECKGRIIFDTIWEDKENKGEYDSVKIGRIFTYGFNTEDPEVAKFYSEHEDATIDDLIQFLSGMDIGVDVKMETTQSGKRVQRVTKYSVALPRNNAIDDEDLPF